MIFVVIQDYLRKLEWGRIDESKSNTFSTMLESQKTKKKIEKKKKTSLKSCHFFPFKYQ